MTFHQKVTLFFIHRQEGYIVILKPLNGRLCLVTNSMSLVMEIPSTLVHFNYLVANDMLVILSIMRIIFFHLNYNKRKYKLVL
jgi:hypothetical protein